MRSSRSRLTFLVCFAAGLADVDATAATALNRELPPGTTRVQKAQIIDSAGFGQPMPAVDLLIPVGWQTQGGVVWDPNRSACGKASTRFEWRAVSADGLSAIEFLPEESWSGNNLQLPQMKLPCPNITITNIKDYLSWYASRVRPGARLLDFRARPDMIAHPEIYNRENRGAFGDLKTWAEGGEILLAYQIAGQDVRESIGMIVMFTLNRMSGVAPGEIRQFLTIAAQIGFAVRAPAGKLDFKFAEMIRRSIKSNPQWAALMAEHNRVLSGIAAKGQADRHEIRMKTAAEIAEINRQTYQNTQAVNDKSAEKFTQTIRGVETYVDPTTKERTELPNNYERAWRLNDGTFLLTNDVNFQPNRDLGIQGQKMEIAK